MMRPWLRWACRAASRATRSGIVLRPGGVSTKTVVRANLDCGLAIHATRDRPRWATVAWLRSARAHGKRSMIFTPRLSPTAEVVTVLPVFDCTTAQISTRPTCAIWMGISWPRFAVALEKDNEELAARSTQISYWSEIQAVAFDPHDSQETNHDRSQVQGLHSARSCLRHSPAWFGLSGRRRQ